MEKSTLKSKTVKELKNLAKNLSLKNYSRFKKNELIKLIIENQKEETEKIIEPNFKTIQNEAIKSPMRIYHIADIHLNVTMNFKYLKAYLKKAKSGIVIIVGDIFHKPDYLTSNLICKIYSLFRKITEKHILMVVVGNHDTRTPQKSTILEWFSSLISNYYYIYPNIIYTINKLFNMIHIPYWDPFPAIKNSKISSESMPTIGLFHDAVFGARNSQSYIFEDVKVKSQDLDHLALCLLGHIHKRQYISERIHYPGSLSQLNFAEEYEKGITLWYFKPENNIVKSKHIPIYSNTLFIKLSPSETILEKFLQIPNIEMIKKYLEYINFRFDLEIKYDQIDDFKKKFPNIKIGVIKGQHILLKESINTNLSDKKFRENDLKEFDNFLKEKKINQEECNNIIDLHKKFKENIFKQESISSSEWNLVKLEFKNVFAYGNDKLNWINFNESDIIHIFGKNGIGKSSILNIILFALFGRKSLISPKDIINKQSKKYKISLTFKHGTTKYKVIHNGSRAGERIKNSTKLYSDKKLVSTSYVEIADIIIDIVGSQKSFLLTNVHSASIGTNFTDLTPKEQLTMLANVFKLEIYEKIRKKALTEIKTNQKEINKIKGQIIELEAIINEYTPKKINFSERIEKNKTREISLTTILSEKKEHIKMNNSKFELNKLKEQIKKYNQEKTERFNEEIKTIKTKIKGAKIHDAKIKLSNFLSEKELSEKKIQTLNEKLEKNKNSFDKQISIIKISSKKTKKILKELQYKLTELNADITIRDMENLLKKVSQDKLENDINKFVEVKVFTTSEAKMLQTYFLRTRNSKKFVDIDQLKKDIEFKTRDHNLRKDNLKKRISKNKKLIEDWACEIKKNELSFSEKKSELLDKIDIEQRAVRNFQNKIQKLKKHTNGVENDEPLKKLEESLINKQIEKDKFIQFLTSEKIPKKFSEKYENLISEKKKLKILRREIKRIETLIKDTQNIIKIDIQSQKFYESEKEKIKEKETNLADLVIELKRLEFNEQIIKKYCDNISFKNFPSHLLFSEINLMIDYANRMLSSVGTGLSLIFSENKFYFGKKGQQFPIKIASGYETLIINLVLKFVMQKLNYNSISRVLFIDEGLDCIDSDNINIFSELINDTNDRRTTFLITHSKRFQEFSTKIINVYQDGLSSKLSIPKF